MATTALLIDFGSTYTKLRAIDVERRRILGSGQGIFPGPRPSEDSERAETQ